MAFLKPLKIKFSFYLLFCDDDNDQLTMKRKARPSE